MTQTIVAEATLATRLRTSLVQSLLSFSFDIGGLLTGILLLLFFGIIPIKAAPWSLILFPGVLSVRGAIGGLFSGHLSTGLHLGTVKTSFTENTKDFNLLLQSVVTLTLISGVSVCLGASLFGAFLWKATVLDLAKMLLVIVATMALSVLFVSPITMGFSILSFRRGLDPDVLVYPVISTLADIVNTICYILCLRIFFMLNSVGYYLIGILDLIFISSAFYILIKNAKLQKFRKIIREFSITLLFVTFIVNVTGIFLDRISVTLESRLEIYLVYPALITTMGGVGSIIGSTATTKLALGIIKPSFSSIRQHIHEIGGAWIASIIMYIIYSIVSSSVSGTLNPNHLLGFAGRLLAANVLAGSAMIIIAYTVAVFTYRRGLDPDNFVIPLESSLADSITTISLLVALSITI